MSAEATNEHGDLLTASTSRRGVRARHRALKSRRDVFPAVFLFAALMVWSIFTVIFLSTVYEWAGTLGHVVIAAVGWAMVANKHLTLPNVQLSLGYTIGSYVAAIAVGALICCAFFFGAFGFISWLINGGESLWTPSTGLFLLDVATVILLCVVAPLVEEVLFRRVLLTQLYASLPPRSAVVLSAWMFALAHMHPLVIPQFVVGIALAILRLRSGSIWPCIAMHSAYNTTLVILMAMYF